MASEVGPDDDARVILAAMFDRIIRGPHVALDVDPDAPPAEVRAAFHTLAKQYHPARFGRMSADTQRLANEVFLGLRMAHDNLMKAQAGRQSTATGIGIPARSRSDSTQPPPLTGRPAQPGQPLQPLRPPAAAGSGAQRQTGQLPLSRTAIAPTTNHGTGPVPLQRPAATSQGVPQRQAPATGTGPRTLPTQQPAPRGTVPAPRPPTGQTPPVQRTQPLPVNRQSSQAIPVQGRTQTEPKVSPPDGIRIAGARPPSNPRLSSAIELIARQQWDAAHAALSSLAAEQPESNQIRALQAYALGRRAQLEARTGEARVELNRALQLDPDLALAKTAIAELYASRK